jgi:hypothetical protein
MRNLQTIMGEPRLWPVDSTAQKMDSAQHRIQIECYADDEFSSAGDGGERVES